jgi:hypothetical protein
MLEVVQDISIALEGCFMVRGIPYNLCMLTQCAKQYTVPGEISSRKAAGRLQQIGRVLAGQGASDSPLVTSVESSI